MSFLEVTNLTKRYHGEKEPCVRNFDLTVERGEICVLLGASGCGKSTILKVIAGLEDAQVGTVRIDGEPMEGIAPEKRPVAMVFQKALLFRNMTVEQNVNFAPRVNRTMPKDELARKTSRMLELVGLAGMEKKKATALSGGQEQRVSLARALMVEPKLLLLDEPLSALDASLRESMQGYIRSLNRETGTTMVLVTHDQQEAIALADRIAVMHDGRIIQIASPHEFYERPSTEYVASFFGWKNFTPATRTGGLVTSALGTFEIPGLTDAGVDAPESGLLVMRPEAAINVGAGNLTGLVRDAVYRGMTMSYQVECEGVLLSLATPSTCEIAVDETLSFDLDPKLLWFVEDDGEVAYSDEA
jgi:ABC-type Fe3+/spermidine/putrescine transport system ATPase subunit